MQHILEKAKKIHYLLHLHNSDINISVEKFTYFIYSVQLLNQIGYFTPNQDINSIYNLIQGAFIFTIMPERYYPIIQIILFLLNLIIIIFTTICIQINPGHNAKRWIILIKLINITLNIYPFIFYISNLWVNFQLLLSDQIFTLIIAVVNIGLTLGITSILTYFQRADTLSQNEGTTTTLILLKLTIKLAELVAIYFSDNTISFILIHIIFFINTLSIYSKISEISYTKVQINILSFCLGISLKFNFWLMDYLMIITLVLILQYQIYFHKSQQILQDSESISGCQLAEKLYSICMTDKQARIQLQIFKNNHRCVKCKAFYDIIECILKRKGKTYNDKLIYSNFISKKWPLRALVELFRDSNQNYYYKSALQTFKLNYQSLKIANFIQTTFTSQQICDQIINRYIKLIDQLISFWNKTIMNELGIEEFYRQGRFIGQQILNSISSIDAIYDLSTYKLKEMEVSDVITLRLLQVYYSIVNVNLIKAQDMEDKIIELFRNDKFKPSTIDNNLLATNRMLILTASLINNPNKIINPKYDQMSQFFNTSIDELQSIKEVSDIMPSFLGNVHEQLIENFIQKGQTKLMLQGESTFYQDQQGYIVPCYIHLLPLQSEDDYLINVILTKEPSYNESIIFGMNGKLFGITQNFFEFTQSSSLIDNYTKGITVNDIICKGSLIQYYMDNILDQVALLKLSIERHQNYIIPEVQSIWKYPENHASCIMNTQMMLKQSMNIPASFSNFISQKTYLQTSEPSKVTIEKNFEQEESSNISNKDQFVEGVEWSILCPNYNDTIKQMLQQFSLNQSQKQSLGKTMLIYSLQFKKISIGKSNLGYFVMEIKEYQQEVTQKSNSFYQTIKSSKQSGTTNSELLKIPELDQINSEKTGSNNFELVQQIQQIQLKNHLVYLNKLENDKFVVYSNYLSSINITKQKMQSYDQENSSRLLKIQTDRQPKKLLLTARIELQSMNVQQEDDDILQFAERDFQDILGERIYNQAEDQPMDTHKKIPKEKLEQQQTKILDKQSCKMDQKLLNQIKDTFSYLEQLSNGKFTLSSLQKFTYFSICIVSLLFLTIVLECNKVYSHIQTNQQVVIEFQNSLKFQRIFAIKYEVIFAQTLIFQGIISIDQLSRQAIIDQAKYIYRVSTYNEQLEFINNYNSDPLRNASFDYKEFLIIYQQMESDLLQIYENTTNQQLYFSKQTEFILNKIYQQLILDLNSFQDQTIDYLQISVFIVFYILFIVYQIRYLFSKNKVIQKLLKLIYQTNISKIQNQKARLQTCKEILQNSNSKNWKLSSFISIIQEDLQIERLQKKQLLDFDSNLSQSYTYPSFITIIILVLFVVGGGILQEVYYQNEYFLIQKDFITLNLMLDQSLLFGSIIKGFSYIDFQNDLAQNLISDFQESTIQQVSLVNNIVNQLEILQTSNLFDDLLGNFCTSYSNKIPQCSTNQQFQSDMLSLIEKGLITLTNNIQQVIRTEFIYELTNNKIMEETDETVQFLASKSFLNTFIIYFAEVINVLDSQVNQIINVTQNQNTNYVLVIYFYEIAIGIIIILLYLIYGYFISSYHSKDFQSIILFMRTMPNEQMQLKNTLHQIKSIVQET